MSILLCVPRILWKIGLISLIRFIFPHPIFSYLYYFVWFVFLDPMMWQGIGQIFGGVYAEVFYRSKLPSKSNYICKADYILPFSGKWTVANGGVDRRMSHSWSVISQRYAYDFIIVDEEGKSYSGNNKFVQNYYCYGNDIIAPADGVVVKISSKHKDSRVNGRKAYCDTWDIRGNFVVIKHNEREYSLIAHLAPNSIMVNVGDTVNQSDVIAKCGNTGNTSEPHIHFQLQSGKSFFASVGLPISFSYVNALEKTPQWQRENRSRQTEPEIVDGVNKMYIGRGLEVENT